MGGGASRPEGGKKKKKKKKKKKNDASSSPPHTPPAQEVARERKREDDSVGKTREAWERGEASAEHDERRTRTRSRERRRPQRQSPREQQRRRVSPSLSFSDSEESLKHHNKRRHASPGAPVLPTDSSSSGGLRGRSQSPEERRPRRRSPPGSMSSSGGNLGARRRGERPKGVSARTRRRKRRADADMPQQRSRRGNRVSSDSAAVRRRRWRDEQERGHRIRERSQRIRSLPNSDSDGHRSSDEAMITYYEDILNDVANEPRHAPSISLTSAMMAEERFAREGINNVPVHERLYSSGTSEQRESLEGTSLESFVKYTEQGRSLSLNLDRATSDFERVRLIIARIGKHINTVSKDIQRLELVLSSNEQRRGQQQGLLNNAATRLKASKDDYRASLRKLTNAETTKANLKKALRTHHQHLTEAYEAWREQQRILAGGGGGVGGGGGGGGAGGGGGGGGKRMPRLWDDTPISDELEDDSILWADDDAGGALDSMPRRMRQEELQSLFDKNGDGFMPPAELRALLRGIGTRLSDQQCDVLISTLPTNADGEVDVRALVQLLDDPTV